MQCEVLHTEEELCFQCWISIWISQWNHNLSSQCDMLFKNTLIGFFPFCRRKKKLNEIYCIFNLIALLFDGDCWQYSSRFRMCQSLSSVLSIVLLITLNSLIHSLCWKRFVSHGQSAKKLTPMWFTRSPGSLCHTLFRSYVFMCR